MLHKLALCFSLLAVAMPAVSSDARRANEDWLTGTWILCEDPDGGSRDSLQFNPDGTGLVIRPKGNIPFLHKHSSQTVSLLANANGVAVRVELSISPALDKLLLHSDRTGNTSFYVRLERAQRYACSAR
jgi:hypothetical protein